ncbi:MAG TPA: MOSC domain-containing protein [Candidatus Acidoferrum sp.]|jgi:MOSC domain-containing protein YiiM
MAKILHIFRAPRKRLPMEELEEAQAIVDYGLEECAHGRPGERQVLLVDRETLEAMELAPGIIRENITTDGINVNSLALEQELRVGEALLKVSAVCHPCDQLEKIRPGLRREMRGRRGMLCRVIRGGTIRRGDPVEKVSVAEASTVAESSGSGLFAE